MEDEEIGPPDHPFAKANRMSPPGISMFYGAFDIETCLKEIGAYPAGHKYGLGQFRNLYEMTLIDFTKLESVPSLFDQAKREFRPIARFLLAFIRDLSIPVEPDDRVHIEYVPTQVVTEFFKLNNIDDQKIDGIIYRSVKNPPGKCVVLFTGFREVLDIRGMSGKDMNERDPEFDRKMNINLCLEAVHFKS